MDQYNIQHCASAKQLLKSGQSNYRGEETDRNLAQRVFDITTKFIAPIDVLALDIKSVDDLLPALRDVQQALTAYPNLPADYQGLPTVTAWVNKMSVMKAAEEISDEDARQLKFELDGAMQRFNDVVLRGH